VARKKSKDTEPEAPEAEDGSSRENISDTPAPSIGPETVIEKEPPEERLARHEQSDVDAMGLDKRREVVGGSYGASAKRQVTVYLSVLVVAALIIFGLVMLVGVADKAPDEVEAQAPWAQPDADPEPVGPIDQ
jgi:hypothetical protein